ncbi:heptaprenyl diphosphate synthase component 1 [Paenibacillus turpanensis]|uniref:heptaprenyl diphosphate synthase component 1 n=1 Tax=Paenibacillus turpanensis TaxID=2689078 RepID=UPI00140C48FE|nr:heptaprenyl diphosphate synthase component 1 [Paenibacillus turpanensis]
MYQVSEIAKKYTEYDMIQKNTDLPEFPEFRTRLLYSFLQAGRPNENSGEVNSLAVSLVQLGLDTHELVDTEEQVSSKKAFLARQMRVLAGDYFSSRFYHLLSKAGHVDVVQQVSQAICEVNRLKMNLYAKMNQSKLTADEYIEHHVDIRSGLFLSLAQKMVEPYRSLWPDILCGFTRCEVLLKELTCSESAESFRGSWAYWHLLGHAQKDEQKAIAAEDLDVQKVKGLLLKYNIRTQLLSMLREQWDAVQIAIGRVDSEVLHKELFAIGEPFIRHTAAPKCLEEI